MEGAPRRAGPPTPVRPEAATDRTREIGLTRSRVRRSSARVWTAGPVRSRNHRLDSQAPGQPGHVPSRVSPLPPALARRRPVGQLAPRVDTPDVAHGEPGRHAQLRLPPRLDVPTTAPSRARRRVSPGRRRIRALGDGAHQDHRDPSAGRSFAECTARSISPSRSARTIVDEQPLPPKGKRPRKRRDRRT